MCQWTDIASRSYTKYETKVHITQYRPISGMLWVASIITDIASHSHIYQTKVWFLSICTLIMNTFLSKSKWTRNRKFWCILNTYNICTHIWFKHIYTHLQLLYRICISFKHICTQFTYTYITLTCTQKNCPLQIKFTPNSHWMSTSFLHSSTIFSFLRTEMTQ